MPPERYAQTIRHINKLWKGATVWRNAILGVVFSQLVLTALMIYFLIVYNTFWWIAFEALIIVGTVFTIFSAVMWRIKVLKELSVPCGDVLERREENERERREMYVMF